MQDRLYFFSRSKDVAPGRGVNEIADVKNYLELAKVKEWRKRLSHFDATIPFRFEGATYRTIEHAFQAKKIGLLDPEKAKLFTIESGHEIGLGDGQMAQKNRKLVKLSPELLGQWAQIQPAFLLAVAEAKWRLDPEVLLLTGDAQLFHIQRAKPAARFLHLEKARHALRREKEDGQNYEA